MVKAKRRKGFDPNPEKEQLIVSLNPNIKLPVGLENLKETLSKEGKKWEIGEVSLKGITYPVLFVPFVNHYKGKMKMYSHVVFSPDSKPNITQSLIDKISKKACLQITQREQRKNN